MPDRETLRAVWPSIRRAVCGRCPRCGEGRLFRSYLKQVDTCAFCGEAFGHIRADDGPPWLTILVVGHLVVPLALYAEKHADWPLWVSMAVWPGLALGLSLALLPRAKGVFLGMLWATGAPGGRP